MNSIFFLELRQYEEWPQEGNRETSIKLTFAWRVGLVSHCFGAETGVLPRNSVCGNYSGLFNASQNAMEFKSCWELPSSTSSAPANILTATLWDSSKEMRSCRLEDKVLKEFCSKALLCLSCSQKEMWGRLFLRGWVVQHMGISWKCSSRERKGEILKRERESYKLRWKRLPTQWKKMDQVSRKKSLITSASK